MIHSSYYQPSIIPVYGDLDKSEIDRCQDITGAITLDRTKIEEIGRDGIVDWRTGIPAVSLTMRQLEYGSIDFWRKLSNKGDSVATILFTDFKTSLFDIAAYKTDDNATFLGTVWYKGMRISGFGLNIGDPEALAERTFTLVGEDEINLLNNNKYLICKRYTAAGGLNETFTVNDPVPVADPDYSGQYLLRVVRTRAGTSSELTHGTEWSYDGVDTLTINGLSIAGDVIRIWYSGSSYIGGGDYFIENDADLAAIEANSCSIYLANSNYLYRLQSAAIDVTLDRYDIKEIGNNEVVARGVRGITARVTLGRILETYTIEEIIRGKAGLNYGKLDIKKLSDNISLIVKFYDNADKTTFKMGYKITDLAPVGLDAGIPLNDYISRGVTLEGEVGFITTDEGSL